MAVEDTEYSDGTAAGMDHGGFIRSGGGIRIKNAGADRVLFDGRVPAGTLPVRCGVDRHHGELSVADDAGACGNASHKALDQGGEVPCVGISRLSVMRGICCQCGAGGGGSSGGLSVVRDIYFPKRRAAFFLLLYSSVLCGGIRSVYSDDARKRLSFQGGDEAVVSRF